MKNLTARVLIHLSGWTLASTLFSSCPVPIDLTGSQRLEDSTKPTIVIVTPVDGTTYEQAVSMTGTVVDDGLLSTVSYTVKGVLGELATGTVPATDIAADGTFTFSFSTVSFTGPVLVEVEAADWNDNTASDSVQLLAPPSSLSSFAVSSGSKAVDLSWNAVPEATQYTVRWAMDGSIPSLSYGSSVTTTSSGYRVNDLENGRLYTFLLSAETPSGVFWSSFEQCIPLSSFTLAPMVEGLYGQVRLEWASISGSSQFEIWRSDTANGTYTNISGLMEGTEFLDLSVREGLPYYYKIRPALEGAPLSTWNAGASQIIPLPGQRTTSIATTATTGKVATYKDPSGSAWAYVAAGSSGIFVFNVTNPKLPSLARTLKHNGTNDARDLVIDGTRLFVADGSAGVYIYSLAVPWAPQQTGLYEGITAASISVVGASSRLYVVNEAGGTSVVSLDMSGSDGPVLVATYSNVAYTFLDVSAANYSSGNDLVYLVYEDSADNVSKLAEMAATTTTLSWYRTYTYTDYNIATILVSGTYVYALATERFYLEPPPGFRLLILGRYPALLALAGVSADNETWGYPADLRHDTATGKLHVVDGIGLKSFDVSIPSTIVLDESLNTPGSPTGIALLGDYAVIGTGTRSFQTFDLRSPVAPSQKAGYAPGRGYSAVAVRGNRAYAAGSDQFSLLSILNPEVALPSLGQVSIPGAVDVAVSGSYAFIAAGANGLKVVDMSIEATPSLIGSALPVAGSLNAVAVKGDYVFCAGSNSLDIFDISTPSNPVWMGFTDSEGMGMHGVALRGNRAFVTDGSYFQPNSLKILDVSDITNPILIAKAATSVAIIGSIHVNAQYAFVADSITGSGVRAIDIDPESGTYLTEYGPVDTDPGEHGWTRGIALSGAYLFALDDVSGFVVIDASTVSAWDHVEPNTGFIMKTLSTGSTGIEVAVEGRYAYIADSDYGLRVIRLF